MELGCEEEMLTICAMMSAEQIYIRPSDEQARAEADEKHKLFVSAYGDSISLLCLYDMWSSQGGNQRFCNEYSLHYRSMRRARDVRGQLEQIVEKQRGRYQRSQRLLRTQRQRATRRDREDRNRDGDRKKRKRSPGSGRSPSPKRCDGRSDGRRRSRSRDRRDRRDRRRSRSRDRSGTRRDRDRRDRRRSRSRSYERKRGRDGRDTLRDEKRQEGSVPAKKTNKEEISPENNYLQVGVDINEAKELVKGQFQVCSASALAMSTLCPPRCVDSLSLSWIPLGADDPITAVRVAIAWCYFANAAHRVQDEPFYRAHNDAVGGRGRYGTQQNLYIHPGSSLFEVSVPTRTTSSSVCDNHHFRLPAEFRFCQNGWCTRSWCSRTGPTCVKPPAFLTTGMSVDRCMRHAEPPLHTCSIVSP